MIILFFLSRNPETHPFKKPVTAPAANRTGKYEAKTFDDSRKATAISCPVLWAIPPDILTIETGSIVRFFKISIITKLKSPPDKDTIRLMGFPNKRAERRILEILTNNASLQPNTYRIKTIRIFEKPGFIPGSDTGMMINASR